MEKADEINQNRLLSWNRYYEGLKPLADAGIIELPVIPEGCVHNAHIFYIKCRDLQERTQLLQYLKNRDILAVFHYIPLHSAPAGLKFGRFAGEDRYTTTESERLLRLPMYYGLSEQDQETVVSEIRGFFCE